MRRVAGTYTTTVSIIINNTPELFAPGQIHISSRPTKEKAEYRIRWKAFDAGQQRFESSATSVSL